MPVFRTDAEEALQGLNGSVIGKQAVRLSWGRSPSHKQVRHVRQLFFYFLSFLAILSIFITPIILLKLYQVWKNLETSYCLP
jgi:hypothetical protein